jgi:hypothetical protein
LFLFLDGVGIGRADAEINPLFRAKLPTLQSLMGGRMLEKKNPRRSSRLAECVPLNATLGVAGLPQSGTGQITLFTGVNAAKIFGRHFGPYAPTTLRPVLEEHNILKILKQRGCSVVFTNPYPSQFFSYMEQHPTRISVSTLASIMAGIPLLTDQELKNNQAIAADITRSRWNEIGFPEIGTVTPQEAGAHLAEITAHNDVTLFEYWLPDHAGHAGSMDHAVEIMERFDGLLEGVLKTCNLETTTIVITSDHGNIEDLSKKTHTRNRVPCIVIGRKKETAQALQSLMDVPRFILSLFDRFESDISPSSGRTAG